MSHFNHAANSWDTSEKIRQSEKYGKKIKFFLPKNSPLKILEIGCGTGLLGSQFIDTNNQLIGIDTSSGMLDVFNDKFKQYKNTKGLLLNLENETLDEDNFDLVISSMAFHHLKQPVEILKKIKPLLSSNARIAIIDLDQEDGSFHPDPANMGVYHFGFSEDQLNLWAKEVGLKFINKSIVNTVSKNDKSYPIFLAIFSN
jgi:ubiquinone/menaquinone biosynthesis C-methylase UbiE